MALNLSTLTSPATSGDVLQEALTTADFLEPCPVLRNLSRGSNKGGDAKQDVALNQPKALPLIDGDGYLYVPDVVSNTCSTPDDSSIDITGDITIDIDLTLKNWNDGTERNLVSKYRTSDGQRSYRLYLTSANVLSFVISSSGAFESGGSRSASTSISFPDNQRAQIRVQWRSSGGRVQFFTSTDKGQTFTQLGTDQNTSGITSIYNGSADLDIAHRTNVNRIANSAIHSVQIYGSVTPSSSSLRFNCDFTATNVRHGATKFKCGSGQVVTINKSGNDPATIIKKPVLRFSDAANTGLQGLFNQTITEGYFFAAFRVLGDGGESLARIFSANSTGAGDFQSGGFTLRRFELNHQIQFRWDGSAIVKHNDVFNSESRGILLESPLKDGDQNSKINNADADNGACAFSGTVSSEEFAIGSNTSGDGNAAIDLEYLALFPATITDAQADSVRNYINNRNNVFDLKDGFGYYFYDAQKAPAVPITSGSSSWNGRIVGSDNGDTDRYATQGTSNDAPVGDGYVVTFADNTDHLEIPQVTQAGWQVVGTSLGTFAYRVGNSAQTEINLLGYASHSRKVGDLYGIILLPESATGSDIQAARQLLIDRGASDGATGTTLASYFRNRGDIFEFYPLDTSNITHWNTAFRNCNLTSFPALDFSSAEIVSELLKNNDITSFPLVDTSNVTNANQAFYSCTQLSSFPALDLSQCNSFTSTWQSCSALTSFPQDAKLGTEASNVNFSSAWRSSGLTSFSTPLPTATSVSYAWYLCSSLTSFSTELPSVTNVTNAWGYCTSLESFSSELPALTNASYSWYGCSSLTSFSTELPLVTNVSYAWRNCSSLSDFSADVLANWNPSSINSGVFHKTWTNCTSLTAQSVENILTSIDTSGQFATTTGASGGSALGDAGIDIDYNVATGSLSAATNAAIDSLSGKGWEVFINGVLVIPNILDLQPAAAYSLRSFDADADPNVVNVRRSSDSALRDFTASEVTDGTLRDWTLGDTLALDGQRMYFDGADDYVDLNQSLIPATGDFSVSLKYAHEEQTATNRYILSQGNSNSTFFGLAINNDTVDCRVAGGGAGAGVFGITSISKGSIYEFKVTRVGDVFTFYVDGVSVGTQTNVGLTISTNTNTYIGEATWTANRFTKGTAYDIKKDGTIYYEGYGNTNADWTDQVGSNDATVYGTPALFSGQGFDGYVTTWYDQSSNGLDSSQSTASSQPKIVDGGTLVTEGGQAALEFGAETDELSLVSSSYDAASIFAVTKPNTSSGNPLLGVSGSEYIDVEADTLAYRVTSFDDIPFTNDFTQQLAVVIREDGTGAQPVHGYRNGVVSTEDPCDTNQELLTGSMSIGRRATSDYYDGTIQEIVIYDSDQSANRTGIETNINDTYTIY